MVKTSSRNRGSLATAQLTFCLGENAAHGDGRTGKSALTGRVCERKFHSVVGKHILLIFYNVQMCVVNIKL